MSQRKSLIDQLLEEAQKRGIYNPATKVERSVIIEDDTHVPAEDRMGYHLLKSNGFTPPFLMERQALIADRDLLIADRDALIVRWPVLTHAQRTTARDALALRLRDMWRRVMDFNLQAPSALHLEGVRIDYELRELSLVPSDASSDDSTSASSRSS